MSSRTYSTGGDGRFREEPLIFSKLPVSLVRLRGCLVVDGQVAVPPSNDVAVEVRVFQVGALEGVNLSLQVCQRLLVKSQNVKLFFHNFTNRKLFPGKFKNFFMYPTMLGQVCLTY